MTDVSIKTHEVAKTSDFERIEEIKSILRDKDIEVWIGDADKEWYKINRAEIRIANEGVGSGTNAPRATPLSELSNIVQKINESKQRRVYVPKQSIKDAEEAIKDLINTTGGS